LLLSLKKQQQNIDQMLRSGVERQRRHGFSWIWWWVTAACSC
jgi:hypothetical protein